MKFNKVYPFFRAAVFLVSSRSLKGIRSNEGLLALGAADGGTHNGRVFNACFDGERKRCPLHQLFGFFVGGVFFKALNDF